MAYEFHAFPIRDGKITLYKRNLKNNAVWQCRFMAQGKCIRRSTKETSVSAATRAAEDLYDETKFRIRHNMPIGLATFETIWKKWIVIMQSTTPTWSAGGHRLKYANSVAHAHFLPYFGKKPITAVTTAAVTAYWPWRESNGKKPPSAATLIMEAQLLRQFLSWAMVSSHIAKIPTIKAPKKVDIKLTRREAFSEAEYETLKTFMRTWINHRISDVAKRRRMFRNFVMIMFGSGMRQNEARKLKWQDVDISGSGSRSCRLTVTGKTGKRSFVAQPLCKLYLEDQYKASKYTSPDDYVFVNAKGVMTKNFAQTFRNLIKAAGVLNNVDGSEKVIYSMRHSGAVRLTRTGLS